MDQDKDDNELLSPRDTIKTISKAIVGLKSDKLDKLGYSQETKKEFASLAETLQKVSEEDIPFKHTQEEIGDVYKVPGTNVSIIRSHNGVWEVRPSILGKGAMVDIDQVDQMATCRFFLSRKPLTGDYFIDSHETFRSPMWQFLKDTTEKGSNVITISLDHKAFAASVQGQSEDIAAFLAMETAILSEKEKVEIKIASLGKVEDYWIYSGVEDKNYLPASL